MVEVNIDNVVQVNEMTERFTRALMAQGATPSAILSGVHNAFVHGDIFKEHGMNFTEQQLEEVFQHLDGLLNVLKDIEQCEK